MNHKLRVLVRMDVDPGHVTLEITGCVTQSDSATLMHIMRRACRLEAGAEVVIDLHGASHLDPEVLLDLRRLVDSKPLPIADAGDAARPSRSAWCWTSQPCCQSAFCTWAPTVKSCMSPPRVKSSPALDVAPDSGVDFGPADAAGAGGGSRRLDLDSIDGLALSEYFEGTLDPAATVRALSDTALCQLADALYRHLDTSTPSFGAHTWYELAAEELQNRHLTRRGRTGGRTNCRRTRQWPEPGRG